MNFSLKFLTHIRIVILLAFSISNLAYANSALPKLANSTATWSDRPFLKCGGRYGDIDINFEFNALAGHFSGTVPNDDVLVFVKLMEYPGLRVVIAEATELGNQDLKTKGLPSQLSGNQEALRFMSDSYVGLYKGYVHYDITRENRLISVSCVIPEEGQK